MLPDVFMPYGQTHAGGQDPQYDCLEFSAVCLGQHFELPAFTVSEAEQWESAHGGNPAAGTTLDVGAALLSAYRMPAVVRTQPLEDAPNRGHYSIPLVKSDVYGIPTATGDHLHYVIYLGGGNYRNPANGLLVASNSLGPAYTGQCIEVDIAAAPTPIIVTGDNEPMHANTKLALTRLAYIAALGREPGTDPTTGKREDLPWAAAIATDGSNADAILSRIADSPEGQAWRAKLHG